MTALPDEGLYLGGELDPSTRARTGRPAVLDPDDLTTHGVIVGMTGSGKTGLGIVLLEELLLKGIPALILDPKGDLSNLALTFPSLDAADFLPWVDEREATTTGRTPDQLAQDTAATWRDGLAGWGIGPERLRARLDAATVTLYTPGSASGVPLDLLGSLPAPAPGGDPEAQRDEVEGFVTGVLGMAGITADPLTSPEHILLANLIDHAWSQGRDLDLAALIGLVQSPPLRKLGVIDIDQFLPPTERQALVVALNGLLASPSFRSWSLGQPLDIPAMLWTPDGRPRAAVIGLAHLSDEERQFVVSVVLAKLVTWMRSQPGTSRLRALLYMDEVAGFVPPVSAPPAKKPILTLL